MIAWRELQPIAFFRGCAPRELRRLARACDWREFRRRQCIYHEGAPSRYVYVIVQGEVVIQKNTGPETDPARLSVVLAGELFGFGEAWLDNYYTSATALAECRLLAIAREDFIRHFMAVPVLRERVLRGFSEMVRILIAKSVAGSGLNELAWFLRNMSTRYGRVEKDWIQIRKKLRQPEIAAVLNLSREHVTRLFAQLRAKGAVRFNRGYPRIARAWLDRAAPDRDLADSIRYRAAAL